MKRILGLICVFFLCSAFQCDDEPLEGEFVIETPSDTNCETATLNTSEAALDFVSVNDDNYEMVCNAYKAALEAQIGACGDENGALQIIIDSLGTCDNTANESNLEGTWLLTAWIGTESIDLNNDGTESTNFLDEMDCYTNETLVFNNDNTGASMSTSFAEIDIFLEVGSDSEVDFNVECVQEEETVDFTWSQLGNTVTITDAFGSNDWTLSGDTLSILIPEGFSVINTEDADVNTIQDLTFVYTKQ